MHRIFTTAATSTVLLAFVSAVPAWAEPAGATRQQNAGHAAFLEGLAAGAGAAVCMVDTGVDDVPDATQVVDRLTLDGGDGRDVSTEKHGTQVAALIGGARNGWGTVGYFPAVKVVSVQASGNGTSYTNSGFIAGVERCINVAATYNIKVITLALGGPDELSDGERALLEDDVQGAHQAGINVIAGAGNTGGALTYPASAPGVLSVGATDGQGLLCSFSARPARLNAPGCDLDGVDTATGQTSTVQGTSFSVSLIAATLAALRSSRPDVTWDQAEGLLVDNADQAADGPTLNAERTFNAAGIPIAPTPMPAPTTTTPVPTETPRPDLTPQAPGSTSTPATRPRLSIKRSRGRLTVRALNRPAGQTVRLRFYRGKRLALTRKVKGPTKVRRGRYSKVTAAFLTSSGATASKTTSRLLPR